MVEGREIFMFMFCFCEKRDLFGGCNSNSFCVKFNVFRINKLFDLLFFCVNN